MYIYNIFLTISINLNNTKGILKPVFYFTPYPSPPTPQTRTNTLPFDTSPSPTNVHEVRGGREGERVNQMSCCHSAPGNQWSPKIDLLPAQISLKL